MNELLELFLTFFKIGAVSFGGGYAMLPLITQEVSSVRSWMTEQEVADLLAIGQVTPGPIAVNAATFAGMKVAGPMGAVVATTGVVLPSFIICLLIASFFFVIYKKKGVQSFLYGVRPATVGLVGYAAWQLVPSSVLDAATFSLDIPATCVAVVSFIILLKTKLDPMYIVLGAAVLGILFYVVGV